MILFENMTYSRNTKYPNYDWTGEAIFVIDETNADCMELITKIENMSPYFEVVLDDNGKLIDITPTEQPPVTPQSPTETELLGQQLVDLELQNLSLQNENQSLGQQLVDIDLRLLNGGL